MKVRWWVSLLLFLTWLMSYIDRSLMPMAIPFIGAEFHIKPALMGVVLSAFFLGYGAMQIPGGLLADRFGPRKAITAGVTAWSVFSVLTGMATGLGQLIWIRVLFGLGEGIHPPAAFKMLSAWFRSAERARANGLVMSSNTIGPMIAPILFAAIMQAAGWRHAFLIISIPGFLTAAVAYWYLRDTPAEHPCITADELSEIGAAAERQEKAPFLELLKHKALWKLFFIYLTWDVTWWGFQAWVPSYLLSRGFTLVKTGFAAALPFAAGFAGLLAAAYVSDHIGRRKTVLVAVLLGNALGMLLTPAAPSALAAVVFLTTTGFFLPAIQGPFWSLPMDLLPSRVMGYASGFINTGGQIAGVVSPIVIGALIQSTGRYEAGFLFMAVSATASALLVGTLREPGARQAAPPAACASRTVQSGVTGRDRSTILDFRVSLSELQAFTSRVLASAGIPPLDADRIAALMVEADARGAEAHGVFRLPQYVKRIQSGGMNRRPNIRVVRDQPAAALVDGDNAMGHLVMSRAAEIAIEKARTAGVAWVGARNSNHAGPALLYARMPLVHDMIGLYLAVGSANHLAPWGGSALLLSTNPIAIAVPAARYQAVVLDMATTTAAYGKIKVKQQRGEPLPEGWMIDRDGKPLTDPRRVSEGLLLPIGGPKGYGLALMFGLLAGTLNGAAFGSDVVDFNKDTSSRTNTGHAIIAVNVAAFADVQEFKEKVDAIWETMKSSPRLPGVGEIWLPGERSARVYENRVAKGIPLSPELRRSLDELADHASVERL